MFTGAKCRKLVSAADVQPRTMILLGRSAGYLPMPNQIEIGCRAIRRELGFPMAKAGRSPRSRHHGLRKCYACRMSDLNEFQRSFANVLGIVPGSANRVEFQRQIAKRLAADEDGEIFPELESEIDKLSMRTVLIVYEKGKNTVVDIVEVEHLEDDDKGNLSVAFLAPKLDRSIGEMEFDKDLSIRVEKIVSIKVLSEDTYANIEPKDYKNAIAWAVDQLRTIGIEATTTVLGKPTKETRPVHPDTMILPPAPESKSGCLGVLLLFGAIGFYALSNHTSQARTLPR